MSLREALAWSPKKGEVFRIGYMDCPKFKASHGSSPNPPPPQTSQIKNAKSPFSGGKKREGVGHLFFAKRPFGGGDGGGEYKQKESVLLSAPVEKFFVSRMRDFHQLVVICLSPSDAIFFRPLIGPVIT